MLGRGRFLLVILLAVAGALLSLVLLFQHHDEPFGVATVNTFCGETTSGCNEVNKSPYAAVGGFPLAGLGLAFYASLGLLMALAALSEPEAAQAMALVGLAGLGFSLAVDMVLLGLQAFAIHAFCKLCLATYVLNAAGLLLLGPARRAAGAARTWLTAPSSRALVAAWLLGSLGFAAAAETTEVALATREKQRARLLLGDPAEVRRVSVTPAAPAPAPAASAEPATTTTTTLPSKETPAPGDATRWREEARHAQEQAKKLQETLDDPQKLQQYLNDKAVKDYESSKPVDVDLTSPPSRGPASAPVKVVTYSDFLCPWCRQLANALGGYLPQTSGRVALYFKNYPLDQTCNEFMKGTVHAGACWLALGGVCANEQGRFWPYHDKVFGNPIKDPTQADVVKLAGEVGLNPGPFESCLTSPKTKERLNADIQEGKRIGVTATPTVLVNGKKLPNLNMFVMAVDKELARMGLPPVPQPQGPPEGK